MRILPVFLIVVLILTFLAGCSSSPSASEGRDILEGVIQSNSNGLIKLVEFEKTNGQESEFMGVKAYAMEFQATIEFTADCYWNDAFQTSTGRQPMFSLMTRTGNAQTPQTILGEILFEKTEQGWRGELRSTRVLSETKE